MDFIRSIQNIQQKPLPVRQRILFVSVAIIMALVVISWVMVTSRRLGANMFDTRSRKETKQAAAESPFGVLKDTFTDAAASIRAQIIEFNGKK